MLSCNTVTPKRKHAECPTMREQLNKFWYTHAIKYYVAVLKVYIFYPKILLLRLKEKESKLHVSILSTPSNNTLFLQKKSYISTLTVLYQRGLRVGLEVNGSP